MGRSLPYPGHTWSITQHAIGSEPKTLYDFLKCAAPFEAQTAGYAQKINELMSAAGILTQNIRDETPDAWRDYQQILAELGLIYSTKIERTLSLTELGHMFLAGEIGFSELMGSQALRYQYPNGQKFTIQSRLKIELAENSIAIPETLTELQVEKGVLLKPGALVLRVLLELFNKGMVSELSVDECQAFLLPCKTNKEWPEALAEIASNRSKPNPDTASVNRHARRNVQDWFKFLDKSDFIENKSSQTIGLTQFSIQNPTLIAAICSHEEDAATFWLPSNYDIQSRRTWFDWYGQLPYDAQFAFRTDKAEDHAYIEKNYVAGVEDDEDMQGQIETSDVKLQPIDLAHLGRQTSFSFSGNIKSLVEKLQEGAQKRHAKTLLHDRIIKDLAETFMSQGAKVESDPNSIDLFSTWPDGRSAIFEVKTVTRKSLQGRLRTAIGQVEEYAYRRKIQGASESDKVVVINTELSNSSWQTDFLTQHLRIGLICKHPRGTKSFAPKGAIAHDCWGFEKVENIKLSLS